MQTQKMTDQIASEIPTMPDIGTITTTRQQAMLEALVWPLYNHLK
jgi:hypothetical protein